MAAAYSITVRFMTSGIARVAATKVPRRTRVPLWRVAHMTSSVMLKSAKAVTWTRRSPSTAATNRILPSRGSFVPDHVFAREGLCQDGCGLVFVDFVFGQFQNIQMVLPQLL